MANSKLIERLHTGGILDPETMVAEARRVGLALPVAAAMLEKESFGGRNVFGSDPGGIFIGAGAVTKAKYLDYRKQRRASGNEKRQGVGPCQLTWWEFQDDADREGGCWKPEINMRVGFRRMASLMKDLGPAKGAEKYNGSGPNAVAYSKDLLLRVNKWEQRLAGLPVPSAPSMLDLGDSGPLVVKLTRRLSYVRRKGSREPYLDGARKRLDSEAVAAVRAFQADHRLEPDGVAGPKTAHKLNRAVALERARRKKDGDRPRREPVARRLPALVEEVKRRDAETDRAWTALAQYGQQQRRVLRRLRGGKTPSRPHELQSATTAALDGIMAVLLRMESALQSLLKIEQKELEAAAPTATAATAAPIGQSPPPAPGTATETAVVTEVAPPAEAGGPPGTPSMANGAVAPPAAPGPPAPPPPARRLEELTDAELLERVERLDRALGRARGVLISRYAKADAELALLGIGEKPKRKPEKDEKRPEPPEKRPTERRPDDAPAAVRPTQKALNDFVRRFVKSLAPLKVDGKKGPLTTKRILEVKFFLGYPGEDQRPAMADETLLKRARRPRSLRYSDAKTIARGVRRRRAQRKRARKGRSLSAVRLRMVGGAPHWGGSGDVMIGFVEPFMAARGLPIGQGKRTPAVNASVGGSATSDHLTTKTTTAARDFPTFQGEDDARALARAMGIRTWQPNSYTAYPVTAGGHNFRVQILWGSAIQHGDHVHVGVSRV